MSTTEPVRILVYKTYSDMARALPFSAQAVSEGLQTQNMAFSGEQVLIINGAQPEQVLVDSVTFGLSQLLVGMHSGQAVRYVPSWLLSGLAGYISCSEADDYIAALRYGIFTKRVQPLPNLVSFGGTPEDIIIAYGQANSVVEFLIGTYGEEKIRDLFSALKRTLNIDLALEEVYGLDQHDLDKEWRSAMGMEPLSSP